MSGSPRSRVNGRYLVTLFVLAWLLRMGVALVPYASLISSGPDRPISLINPRGDGYDALARNLLAGEGYRFKPGYAHTTLRMPLYPGLLVGLFAVFGERLWVVQAVQSAFGAATAVLIVLLASRIFDPRGALAAGAVWALYPGDWIACARYLAEPLSILLIMLSTLAFVNFVDRPTLRRALLVGLGLAAVTQTKSSNCLVPLVFLLALLTSRALWVQRRALVIAGLGMLMPVALASLPWMYRGHRLTGHWFYPSTLGGLSLMDGYFVGAGLHTGKTVRELLYEGREHQGALAARHGIELDPADNYYWTYRTPLGEYQMDRLQKAEFLDLVRAEPLAFLERSVKGLARYWYLGRTHKSSLIGALIHAPLLLLALWGLIRARRSLSPLLWLSLLMVVHFNVLNAVIDPLVRYAVTAVPFLAFFIGALFTRWEKGPLTVGASSGTVVFVSPSYRSNGK